MLARMPEAGQFAIEIKRHAVVTLEYVGDFGPVGRQANPGEHARMPEGWVPPGAGSSKGGGPSRKK